MSGHVPRLRPFDESGLARDSAGILRFTALPGSVPALLESVAGKSPDAQAIAMAGGPSLTYRQLLDACARVAGGLREQGVRRGDRVGLVLGNGIDWCLGFLGAMCAGAVPVPVNTRFAAPEIDHVLRDADVRMVIAAGDALPDGAPYLDPALDSGDLACLIYTSGTTGAPKGAMLTHGNVVAAAEVVVRELALPFGEVRSLLAVPLFHVMGSINQLLPALWAGGAAVILPGLRREHVARGDRRTRSTRSPPFRLSTGRRLRDPDFPSWTPPLSVGRLRRGPYPAGSGSPDHRGFPKRAGTRLRPHRVRRQRLLAAS